ncbi:hypothetical protein [Candidatus Tisiphia endosymbiont of Sialis lutaria]|uniref:hypothetical protein n=1 Tax=Candidatus Tisiphia endosymbiont of Sialis lutaria TaxID=2029164 RepID=UPI00312CABD5
MSYFLQPKRVKYRITLVIVGSLLEVTTSPTSPELTIAAPTLIGLPLSFSSKHMIFIFLRRKVKYSLSSVG